MPRTLRLRVLEHKLLHQHTSSNNDIIQQLAPQQEARKCIEMMICSMNIMPPGYRSLPASSGFDAHPPDHSDPQSKCSTRPAKQEKAK